MSEPENQDPPSAADTAETPEALKKRDEKGLTLSGRLVLRMLMEHIRIQTSASRMGGETSLHNTLTQETMIDAVEDVVFFARQMAEKIGTARDVNEYLITHQDADEKALHELRTEWDKQRPPTMGMGIIGAMRPRACDVCGQPLCQSCGTCHHSHKEQPLN